MANYNSRRGKKRNRSPVVVLITVIIALLTYLTLSALDYFVEGFNIDIGDFNIFELFGEKQKVADPLPVPEDGEVIYHFIDVGQGDAILITTPDGNMLIDTSIQGAREELTSYLDAAGVKDITYLVLTHPDADHIGNADHIILNYNVENVILTDHVSTSKTYERMLDAIEEKNVNTIIPKSGDVFRLGALTNTVIAPNDDYDDPNEMSIVIKSVYGDTSVMLTGDAEVESEGDIVKRWSAATLKCDILKVGHHGSTTSTTDAFLNAVDPEIAVISCGEGNKYGHPHDETIEKLTAKGITIYRTDTDGSIIFKTDGKEITLVEKRK